MTRGVLWGLVLCMMVAAGSAALLTNILTRPIHNLGHAAQQLRKGHFETRTEVSSADEVGCLAVTFNQMAEGLQRYRQEVQAKERARVALVEKTIRAQEEERKRLSRELHDQFAQSLTALLVAMQSRCPRVQDGQNPCRDLDKTVRELIGEAHRMAWGLRPSILDDYGLDSALGRHIAEVSQRSGVQIDYRYTCAPDTGRLPNHVEVTLFRVAQEALTNIVRHAQATRASVVVLRQGDHVALFVEDNGRGFDLASVQDKGDRCLGLTGMKERVALLGGVCALESTPGKGTTILVRIPLNEKPLVSLQGQNG